MKLKLQTEDISSRLREVADWADAWVKSVRGGYNRHVKHILDDSDRLPTLAKDPYFWSLHEQLTDMLKEIRQELLVPYPGIAAEVKRRYDETTEPFRGLTQLSTDTDWLVDTVTLFAEDLRNYAEQIDRAQQHIKATLPPLPAGAAKIFEMLRSLEPHEAKTLSQIQAWYEQETEKNLDDGTWKRWRRELEAYGMKNRPNVGYYIREE